MVTFLITGGTGFVGSRLAQALSDRGETIKVMTRSPEEYSGPGTPVYGDIDDPETLAEALKGVGTAFYLIHSLDADDFEEKDAAAAYAFGESAALHGVSRIIYLGGLGADTDDLSAHLRSRREVEGLLKSGGLPVTVLRAAVIVGHGGASWEITRQLVEKLPGLVVPPWAKTLTQPIGIDDVVRYLVAVADHPNAAGKTYEIGGADQLTYLDMLQIASELHQGHELAAVTVPLPSKVTSIALSLLTDVDSATTQHLIESMGIEVVVTDPAIREITDFEPIGYRDQVIAALAELRAADQS